MECRYLTLVELNHLFEKKIVPEDIIDGNLLGVTETSYFSSAIEASKIAGVLEKNIESNYANVMSEVELGRIWMLELSPDKLSRLLLNDTFFNDYCDKRTNPIELSKRISLYYDDVYSYWTENVYIEAFE